LEGVNELQAATKKWSRSEKGGRGGQFGKISRPKHFAELTTPSAALRWLRNFLLMPQPPLLC